MRLNRYTNSVGEEIGTFYDTPHSRFFDIDMYGTTNPNPSYGLYLNPHMFHVFEYVVSGRGYIDYEDKHLTVGEGDFYFIRRGFIGHYYADSDEPYKKIWVNISGTQVDDLVISFNITDYALVCRDGAPMESILRRLHDRLDNCESADYAELMRQLSGDIFEMLSLAKFADNLKSQANLSAPSSSIERYIRTNVFNEIDLDSIAARYHMNPSYLIRIFKRDHGVTPMRYYNMCRIEMARSLLQKHSVKSVAALLQYTDAAYFSACFKAETGWTPRDYTSEVHERWLKAKG